MEEKKLCKDCKTREKNGFCVIKGLFVPKKQTLLGYNRAGICDHFKKK